MKTLITGAGGSIGSALAKKAEGDLVLFDNCEYNLYRLDKGERILGDVRDVLHLDSVFAKHKPDTVFHVAAIKHVPISEENPEEAILTNVFGTLNVAMACLRHGVKKMTLVSTDKAVNPVSVMGKTKRLAERICHSLKGQTQFVTVRFGNVLGTSGSFKPLFETQIAKGGPVTITHPEMTRYFIEVEEAVSLVLKASTRESGIYVLDMGEPVRLMDFAQEMIGERDVPIEIIGARQGEKLHEELFYPHESPVKEDGIFRVEWECEIQNLENLLSHCVSRQRDLALAELDALI